ncbi:hypothetical protein NDN08_002257 [Rhodosorus marinus]|uniref:Small ribosomal subunit protein mS35 mitochondrial conserved domain-containing protein n=1 Tax=Rhodosorus marinus TaxID=101924 RepID=A0AAV8UXH9_9RHOD|nr:hypothetical protein NDN08_002257 [Rhodosorus marinus]
MALRLMLRRSWNGMAGRGCREARRFVSSGGGGGKKEGDGDDDGDELFDLFNLEDEDEEELARKKRDEALRKKREHDMDENVIAARKKEEEERMRKEAQLSTTVADSILDQLVGVVEKANQKDLTDSDVQSEYTRITKHLLQVFKYTEFDTFKVFSYDGEKLGYPENRIAVATYHVGESDLSFVAKHAVALIAGRGFNKEKEIVKMSSGRYNSGVENQLFLGTMMERLVREAKLSVGEKVPESDLEDMSDSWDQIVKASEETFGFDSLKTLMNFELKESQAEQAKADVLKREFQLHHDYWYSKEGIKEMYTGALKYREERMRKQQRVLRRVPKDFVENKIKRFGSKDYVLW